MSQILLYEIATPLTVARNDDLVSTQVMPPWGKIISKRQCQIK